MGPTGNYQDGKNGRMGSIPGTDRSFYLHFYVTFTYASQLKIYVAYIEMKKNEQILLGIWFFLKLFVFYFTFSKINTEREFRIGVSEVMSMSLCSGIEFHEFARERACTCESLSRKRARAWSVIQLLRVLTSYRLLTCCTRGCKQLLCRQAVMWLDEMYSSEIRKMENVYIAY